MITGSALVWQFKPSLYLSLFFLYSLSENAFFFFFLNSAHQPLSLSTSRRSVTSNVLIAETRSKGHRAKPQMEMGTDPQTFGTPLLCTMQATGLLYPPTPTLASPSVSHVNPTKN